MDNVHWLKIMAKSYSNYYIATTTVTALKDNDKIHIPMRHLGGKDVKQSKNI